MSKARCRNNKATFTPHDPIIKKIQGSNEHIGRLGKLTEHKVNTKPTKNKKAEGKKDEIETLKEKLKQAVKEEKYEEAAKLRDEIASKENKKKGNK